MNRKLTPAQRHANQALSAARAPVEHGFADLKQWRILTRLRLSPARATIVLRALLVLTRQHTTRLHGHCAGVIERHQDVDAAVAARRPGPDSRRVLPAQQDGDHLLDVARLDPGPLHSCHTAILLPAGRQGAV